MKNGGARPWRRFWKRLGPGIITGAADDDPSGIVTYAIAGTKGGFAFLWTALITFPLMAAIQEMCARIGLVTSSGLAGVMRRRYSRPLLWALMALTVFAHTFNIGADLGGMSEAASLLLPLPPLVWGLLFTALIVVLMIRWSYRRLARVFKWLTLALFTYIAAAFAAVPNWSDVLAQTVRPSIAWNAESITILVAILGTTISPYLFFWQASEEVEERQEKTPFRVSHHIVTKHELRAMREDVRSGMFFSNLVMFFIMVNAGAVFHGHGVGELETAGEVANALRPLVGPLATLLYAVGIIGTGLLAIPVLAGSAAYVVAETFGFSEGLNKRFHEAKAFYGIIILSTLVGFAMNFFQFRAVDVLFASGVVYGVVAPVLILLILDIANNRAIMGNKTNTLMQNILGATTLLLMTASVIALLVFSLAG
jgi:NRAMP (natural resistance-associated macrophage protein)-like metal ion transporter